MSLKKEVDTLDQNEFWELSHAAGQVTHYACSLSAQFIQTGVLRIEFNNEIACDMQLIVDAFENKTKSFKQAMEEIRDEYDDLIYQATEYGNLVIGLVAGGYQVAGGIVMCGGYVTCGIGAVSIAHGVNNVYENGRNLVDRRSDTEGPVRKAYQWAAQRGFGGTKADGDIAYGMVDMSLSVYGLLKSVPRAETWRLFRYLDREMVAAWKETRWWVLMPDIAADVITGSNLIDISRHEDSRKPLP